MSFHLFGSFGQVAQALKAVRPVFVEEVAELRHFFVVDSIEPAGAVAPFEHEVGIPQNAEMLRHSRAGDVIESSGDLGSGQLL